ncbi:glycosyltransferase [Paracholeplasma manati]|uniref:glycosyltransferase n=1 Tax=Paracholeplasma manati TaxID=591373 RepID=UPI002407925F|nr:glycosyltransferase [Paracholeplasma manati]MDG0888950.1 glycosyltransferase [Paracholeplasma manati]
MCRILVVINNLYLGGIQKSLMNFLANIDDAHQVDLLVFTEEQKFQYDIPCNVTLIKSPKKMLLLGTKKSDLKFTQKLYKAILVLKSKVSSANKVKISLMKTVKINVVYDIAISYTHDVSDKSISVGVNDFVLNCIKAKKKITFIHTDINQNYEYNKRNYSQYAKFDKIITVSESCKRNVLEKLPHLNGKVIVQYNMLNQNEILKLADYIDPHFDKTFINIVTVARLTSEKGIKRVIEIFNRNRSWLEKIKWYIIGTGIDKNELVNLVKIYNLEMSIYFLGEMKNPYPYIKNAQYFLLPSHYEAAPIVFDECIILKTPILTTKTVSAIEIVNGTNSGYVCENDDKGIERMIKALVNYEINVDKFTFNYKSNLERKVNIYEILEN